VCVCYGTISYWISGGLGILFRRDLPGFAFQMTSMDFDRGILDLDFLDDEDDTAA